MLERTTRERRHIWLQAHQVPKDLAGRRVTVWVSFVSLVALLVSAASGSPANGRSHRSGVGTHDRSLVAAVSKGLSLHRS